MDGLVTPRDSIDLKSCEDHVKVGILVLRQIWDPQPEVRANLGVCSLKWKRAVLLPHKEKYE